MRYQGSPTHSGSRWKPLPTACCRCIWAVVIITPYILFCVVFDETFMGGAMRNIASSWYSMPERRDWQAHLAGLGSEEDQCQELRMAKPFTFQPFLLLTSQKTGSTWLIRKFDTHPNIYAEPGEVMRHFARGETEEGAKEFNAEDITWEAYRDHLERSFWKAARCPEGQDDCRKGEQYATAGYKIMYDQIPSQVVGRLAGWLSCNGVVVLHSMRNPFESYMSYQSQVLDSAGAVSGSAQDRKIRSNDKDVAATLATNKNAIRVSPDHALQYVRRLEEEMEFFRNVLFFHPAGIPYLEINYSDVTGAHAQRYFDAMQAFLGVPLQPMADTLVKLHYGRCDERISNWAQVRDALEGTAALTLCNKNAVQARQADVTDVNDAQPSKPPARRRLLRQ